VSIDIKRGQEDFSDGYAPWTTVDWWPQIFYPRAAEERAAHGFSTEDFRGTELHSLKLV
jgi:hypothetical protein